MKNIKNNEIPVGTTDYYGKEALLRDITLSKIEKIYKKYGFEPLYTPIMENEIVFNGHHGEGEKLLFKLEDKNGEKYVLKYDSTVPLARVISMYDDIKLPYKRYQLQQSYRDDEIDKGHFREFIQCDGDVVGSDSLLTDAEFILISYDALSEMGFKDFTIRLNHRKLIKAIAEKVGINDEDGLLQIQRAIDVADKINKGNIDDVKLELEKTGIRVDVICVILDLITILDKSNDILENLSSIETYFGDNTNAKDGISDLEEIVSYIPSNILKKVKLDFTLARGADYYTGFILEGVINNLSLGAVLGGGRYDNLVAAFSDKNIPAVGMAFGLERLLVAIKELNLDKQAIKISEPKILLYANDDQKKDAITIGTRLREKYNVSLIFESEIKKEDLKQYCENSQFTLIATVDSNNSYCLYKIDEFFENSNNNEKVYSYSI